MKRIVLGLLVVLSPVLASAQATDAPKVATNPSAATAPKEVTPAFVIKKINVVGLKRISKGTVYSYLPVKVGEKITPKETNNIIVALYKTGFFNDVSISEKGGVLTIHVTERPVIGDINISGNDAIKSKDLMEALKKMNVGEGLTYNREVINKVKLALEEQYYNMGYYAANVDIDVKKKDRNRVSVAVNISEGALAIVRNINIIGNKAIEEKTLLKQLKLSTTGFFSWVTHDDRYSREKMQGDIQTITSYYLDRGYLDVKINSATVQVTPDKASVFITVDLAEGQVYKVSGFDLKGKTVIPQDKLQAAVQLKKGDVFSRQKLIDTENTIKDMLGRKGYAFANVTIKPDINRKNHTVFIHFNIDQGNLVYVRHINFSGNSKTNDEVLRHHMSQVEGGLINTDNLKQSKRQLSQLPFVRNVDVKTEKVPNSSDKVDINVKMDQVPSAQVTAGIGYSEEDGILLNASIVQKDVLGTGKTLQFTLVNSDYRQNYVIGYTNPYYTTNGISRGFSVYLNKYDPSAANISSDYSYDEYGGRVNYNIPMSADVGSSNSLNVGYGFNGTDLDVSEDDASTQVNDFVDEYGTRFNELTLTGGWVHNALNRYVFPTKGFYETTGLNLYLPADNNALSYYKATYNADAYFPFTERYILMMKGQLGYGDGFGDTDELPFYSNFYAGGISSIRGYEANTLGPEDSNGDPFGGNFLMDASVALIFPNFISPDNLRTSFFVDGGNVFDLEDLTTDNGFSTSDLRYSAGLDFKWLSPVGLLEFTLAKAINASGDDKTQIFDFMIGANF